MPKDERDMIDNLFTNTDDLTDDCIRSDAGIRITDEGFPMFFIKFNKPVTELEMTRDDLAILIQRMTMSLMEMDNWERRQG